MTGRREVIKAGIAAIAGTQLAWAAEKKKKKDKDEPKPPPPAPLMTKTVPSTGERLAVLGVGTNAYRTDTKDRDQLREVLSGLTEAGASIIDTAPSYRTSEEMIGGLLADIGNRKKAFIATKVTAPQGSLQQGIEMIEESFRMLKTDTIDLLQIHNLNGVEVLFPYLDELKRKGRIRYYGITTSNSNQHAQMVELINSQPLDFVQVDYSLGNRESAGTVLPAAQAKRVAVLINMPFGGRNKDINLFSRVADKDLPDWAAEIDANNWGQVFLKYVVSHPAVTAAIPGMTKIAHLQDNLAAVRGRMPNAMMRARIEKYWEQNFES